jgi:hypothetical protein
VRLEGRKAVLQAFISILARPLGSTHPTNTSAGCNSGQREHGHAECRAKALRGQFTRSSIKRSLLPAPSCNLVNCRRNPPKIAAF